LIHRRFVEEEKARASAARAAQVTTGWHAAVKKTIANPRQSENFNFPPNAEVIRTHKNPRNVEHEEAMKKTLRERSRYDDSSSSFSTSSTNKVYPKSTDSRRDFESQKRTKPLTTLKSTLRDRSRAYRDLSRSRARELSPTSPHGLCDYRLKAKGDDVNESL